MTLKSPTASKATMASSSRIPEEGAENIQSGLNLFNLLPEGCLAIVTSLTTPADVCRLALVSKGMLSLSESDAVWSQFLPSDIDLILSGFDEEEAPLTKFQSKKQLYKRLTNGGLLVDQSSKNFWLDRSSGKKCWMVGARSLDIALSPGPENWEWFDITLSPGPANWEWSQFAASRFPETAVLMNTGGPFAIETTIQTSKLSPSTKYKAYLLYSMIGRAHGFGPRFGASVSVVGAVSPPTRLVALTDGKPVRATFGARMPSRRADGWWEILLGETFSSDHPEVKVSLTVKEGEPYGSMMGIIVDGIEYRPY